MSGFTFYIGDSFKDNLFVLAESFNIYLMLVQLIFLVYIQVDVRIFLRGQKDNPESVNKNLENQQYGFTSSRHGGSLYLKIGATCFAFGYVMHIVLQTAKIIIHSGDNCYSPTDLAMSVIHIAHVFCQLFFLFKYSNLIINRWVLVSKFGVMHCIATSLCFWMYMIYEEIKHSLEFHVHDEHHVDYLIEQNHSDGNPAHHSIEAISKWKIQSSSCNETNSSLVDTIHTLSPFLNPLCVEFNLLIVGLWIITWQNLGKIEKHEKLPSILLLNEENSTTNIQSNLIISVDCHSSTKGLFIGLLMAILTFISIIILFVYTYSSDLIGSEIYTEGMNIGYITELTLLTFLTVTVAIAYRSIQQLDLIKHLVSSVDKTMLFISHPFIFLFACLNLVAYVQTSNHEEVPVDHYIFMVVLLFYIIQPTIQTLFICDALNRCSNTVDLQQKKPGREVVTFLVITNVTMWLLETLQMNTYGANEEGIDFYGERMWRILVHVTMPLTLFYRFHSSVCIANIWKDAYEAE